MPLRDHQDQLSPNIPVCGIGASAGGVEALQQFFSRIPSDLGIAYVVVVHLAPDRKSELPAILSRCTTMPVIQVADNEKAKLQPDHVYVIAPDRKLEITDTSVGASPFKQPRGQRTAIDLFFRSLAESHGDGFAVVLSGGGSDGALGTRAVKEAGGVVLVQDPDEAAHKEMPSAVIANGSADLVLPVADLVAQLKELAHNKKKLHSFVQTANEPENIPASEEKSLRSVLDLLAKRTGHDFTRYKRGTILRRLSRRMQLVHQLTIGDYLRYLREHLPEVQSLFDDFLISVTTFFRDPESWAALQRSVIGPLVEATKAEEQIRVWVPGCATGEEAYTIAILFHEEYERRQIQRNLIIFASDVDENALVVAREGVYPTTISADVSELRLNRYFRQEDDHYRVIPEIRDHLVFAAHNIFRDPPFSRMHLISCRNLLIYLERELQERVMGVFRYACRDKAHLFLGASETADEEYFEVVDKKQRIFTTRKREEGRQVLPELLAIPLGRSSRRETRRSTAAESHLAALEGASPPSVLIDDRWNVLHLSASVSKFLQQSGGTPARRVTELVRAELRDELHALLHRIDGVTDGQLSRFVPVKFNGDSHLVALFAQQRQSQETSRPDILVTFLDAGPVKTDPIRASNEAETETVRHLREDLRQAELRIENVRDDHYFANEDLRAANEELQSLNEEFRSTTEELETSKEELQSVNEELETVNLQLKTKLDEASRSNDDLENLMAATDVATLFLTSELRIKRFTPKVAELFNIKTRDYDRPISDLTHSLDYESLESDARRVLATLQPIERESSGDDGRFFMIRLSPYRTSAVRKVDGVVVTFIEVTAIKKVEAALRESEQRLATELSVMRRLHRMTLEVATAPDMQEALNHLIAATMDFMETDLINVQLLDRENQQLRIVAQRGFGAAFLKRFERVGVDDDCSFGRAMRGGGRYRSQMWRRTHVTSRTWKLPWRRATGRYSRLPLSTGRTNSSGCFRFTFAIPNNSPRGISK